MTKVSVEFRSRWIPELDRTLQGRLLDVWEGRSDLPSAVEEQYRDLFRKEAGRTPKRKQCRFFGEDTGERVKCTPCGDSPNNPRLKIHLCLSPDVPQGKCTVELADDAVPHCSGCNFWQEPLPVVKKTDPDEVQAFAAKIDKGFVDLSSVPHDVVRDAHILLLERAKADPPPVHPGTGRGIVMGVGGTMYFQCAWVATSVLRRLGCTLPVEWWHLGKAEMDPRMAKLASELGVVCRDALEVVQSLPEDRRPRILNGWELKPFSVAHSAFEEVLFLDADNICVQDPTFLFDHPEYLKHGSVFWPDLPPYDRKEWVPDTAWNNVGLEKRDEVDFESGQFLIHKGRCAKELGVTIHINAHSDWYYKFVYGDKTTYHLAWRVCGSDYAIPRTAAGWIWPAIQQHDFDGKVLFQHVCQGKAQLAEGKPLSLTRKSEAVQAALRLGEKWHKGIWNWLDQTPEENDLMLTLVGKWRYTRKQIDGEPTRILELLPRGTIGGGYAGCEQQWSVRIIDRMPTIIITGEAHKGTRIGMMFLTESGDGIWRGRWQAHERGPVELEKVN